MKPVPERETAKLAGERFYSTGKPCKNGHLSKRYTGTGICATCATINSKKCQAKAPDHPNRAAARANGLTHWSAGRDCKHGHGDKRLVSSGQCLGCALVFSKLWREANPGAEADATRKRRAKNPSGHRAASLKWAKEQGYAFRCD